MRQVLIFSTSTDASSEVTKPYVIVTNIDPVFTSVAFFPFSKDKTSHNPVGAAVNVTLCFRRVYAVDY